MTRRSGWFYPSSCRWFFAVLWALALADTPAAQVGTVRSEQKISETAGGFGGVLREFDSLGASVSFLGDLDGNGTGDLAAGAPWDDDGGIDQGAVWILFLNSDGTIAAEQKISATQGGFGGDLDVRDFFHEVSSLGDLDGDGHPDLAVGAAFDDDGGSDQGAVWILFLNADGTVASEQKISETAGGFGGVLDTNDLFGVSLGSLGDLDGDGNQDLAVGASGDGDGGRTFSGAVWILFMNSDGTVASEQKISAGAGGFGGALDVGDSLGASVCSLGDLDGDGNQDLAVGATGDDDGGFDAGAVWILFMNSDGTVASEQKISETAGGFDGVLDGDDRFGGSVSSLGDLDGDGNQDLAVGAYGDDDGGTNQGAVWILFMNSDGTVASEQKVSETAGGFGGVLDPSDSFGPVSALGDLDGDGTTELAVGASGDDDGDTDNQGAVWILFLEGPHPPHRRRGGPLPFGASPTPVALITPSMDKPLARPISFQPSSEGDRGGCFSDLRFHGGANLRNGSGVNQVSLVSATTPRAGADWQAWVDVSAHRDALASLVLASDRALEGTASPFGELLIDVISKRPLFTSLVASNGATDVHIFPLPVELIGRSFSLQALILDGQESSLTNAVDLVVGR